MKENVIQINKWTSMLSDPLSLSGTSQSVYKLQIFQIQANSVSGISACILGANRKVYSYEVFLGLMQDGSFPAFCVALSLFDLCK